MYDLKETKLFYNASGDHLRPSGYNDRFYAPSSSFSEYVDATKVIIKKARKDFGASYGDQTIEWNAPFELRPDCTAKIGVLCLHGTINSPYTVRDLAQAFKGEGCLVRSVLLPGAGTCPGDLLHMRRDEWVKAVKFGIQTLKSEVDAVLICGVSLGATLALHEALEGADVDGLILFSPFIKPSLKHNIMLRTIPYITKSLPNLAFQYKTNWMHPARYLCAPYNVDYQSFELSKKLFCLLKKDKLKQPVLLFQAQADETVSFDVAQQFFLKHSNSDSRAVWYSNTLKSSGDERVAIRSCHDLSKHILDATHLSLNNSFDNPIYGENNPYPIFVHYKYELNEEITSKPVALGPLKKEYLEQYFLQRLTFNPDFSFVKEQLSKFLLTFK